jgi:hypothetical protein
MRTFNIIYQDETVQVQTGNHYRLQFPDGRWLVIEKYPDDTSTTAVENANISYSYRFIWVIEEPTGHPDWINDEQLQVIGELVLRKEQALENG